MLLIPHLELWVLVSLFHLLKLSHVLVPLTLQEWILDKLVLDYVFELTIFIVFHQGIKVFFEVLHPLLEVELPSRFESKLVAFGALQDLVRDISQVKKNNDKI